VSSPPAKAPESDVFARLWQSFADSLLAPFAPNPRATAITVAGIVALALLLVLSPGLYITDKPLDLFIPLDGALRMSQGQWPHADFYSPIGSGYYVMLGLAAALMGIGPKVVMWASVLLAPLMGGACWVLSRDRLPTPLRLAMLTYVTVLVFSPRTLGTPLISYLASYNKHGWATVAIVMLGLLLIPRKRDQRTAIVEGVVLAALTVLAFYLKITYFALCGFVILFAFVFMPAQRWVALGAGTGALGTLALSSLISSHNALYIADLQRAGASMNEGVRFDRLVPIFTANQAALVGFVAFAIWLLRSSRDEAEEQTASTDLMVIIAMLGVTLLIASQSHDHDIPVLPVLGLACFTALRQRLHRREESGTGGIHLVGAVVLAMLAAPVGQDVLAIGMHAAGTRSGAQLVRGADGPLSQIRVPQGQGPTFLGRVVEGSLPLEVYDSLSDANWHIDTGPILSDAMGLIDKHNAADKRIVSLTFSPLFSWIYRSPAPRHQAAWLDHERTFSQSSAGDLSILFDEVDVVMQPKVWETPMLWETYGPTIEGQFERKGETALWVIWVRR